MKAQALEDFVAKMTQIPETLEPNVEIQQVWADGVCRVGGLGIGIVLKRQVDIKLRYTIKLVFNATTNVAKYEAVIMALKIINEVGIQS